MKRYILAYLLSTSILWSGTGIHAEEWAAWKNFIVHAREHLLAGESLMDFLNKHYGDRDTVLHHFQENHPGENPFPDRPHDHETHLLTDAAMIYYKPDLPAPSQPHPYKNFIYRLHYTKLFTGRFLRPPEPSVS